MHSLFGARDKAEAQRRLLEDTTENHDTRHDANATAAISAIQPSCKDCPYGACAFYAPTHARDAALIEMRRSEVIDVKANRHFAEGSAPVYTIYSGWAARYLRGRDGRRQILEFLLPGDTIGSSALLLGDTKARASVVALTDMRLCAFTPAALHELAFADADQSLATRLHLARRVEAMERRMFDLGRRRAIGRIAQLFIELTLRLRTAGHDGAVFTCPIRQDHIADALGLTPEHVSRTLAELKRLGIAEFAGSRLTILDADALEATAADG